MFSSLEAMLLKSVETVSLEYFVFVASFIEEVIAPVPSSSVLLATGSLAVVQGRELFGLIPLVLLAALGKTIGAIGVYYISRALGQVMITRYGRWFGVDEGKVVNFSERLKNTNQAFWSLLFLRALPIMPSALISVGGGVLKVHLGLFLATTLIGTIIRDSFFIYIGFVGTNAWQEWALYSTNIESYIQIGALLVIFFIGIRLYRRRVVKNKL